MEWSKMLVLLRFDREFVIPPLLPCIELWVHLDASPPLPALSSQQSIHRELCPFFGHQQLLFIDRVERFLWQLGTLCSVPCKLAKCFCALQRPC